MKKVISGLTATALIVGILSPMVGHAEEKTIPLAKCEINIIKGKHTKQSPAYGSGICKDLVEGFYSDSAKVYRVSGMVETQVNKSGQKHIIGVPYDGYSEAELTIYLNKTETPKTETPKTETPKTETPKTETPKTETALKVLYKGKVNKTTTTVRDSNSTKGKSLGTLKKNATVEVVESKSGWYKIKHNKGYGWVVTKDVTKNSTVKVLYKGKTTSDLNVRSTNSTKGKKLGTLKKNTKVEVVQSKSGWYKIKYKKDYGWVSSKYVKKS
uniref:SH3b domain-containing protein n=1 Tax=Aeromonas sp. Ne-1 TaxID=1675689 RepID=A0A0H4JD47_9GAMM|nr:SH3 domain-containing protein [Aeromonas sp. Ne-1]AKO69712.1 hypothetical protein [Aeromonas sp. Ne-1]